MKNDLVSKLVLLLGASIAASPSLAGLSISDSPLFVTEVLAPNVIISPAYRWNANEVSLMDIPWDTMSACGYGSVKDYIDRSKCPKTLQDDPGYVLWRNEADYLPKLVGAYQWVNGSAFTLGPWRVTPWPGMKWCKDSENRRYACTDQEVYPDDGKTSFGMTNNKNINFRYEEPYGAKYVAPYTNFDPSRKNAYGFSPGVLNYDPGRIRYARSDLNFLYYREGLKDFYKPWPALGDKSFEGYADLADALAPYYNPLSKKQKATLGLDQSYVYVDYDNSGNISDAYIGKYYKYNGPDDSGKSPDVWRPSSYTEHVINFADKDAVMPFANWYTYWRSSYLASRGLMATVLSELQNRKLLDRFRIGLNYKKKNGDREVELKDFSSDATKKIKDLAGIIYDYDTNFSGWDHSATLSYFKQSGAYKDKPDNSVSDWSGVRSCRRNYEIVIAPDYSLLRSDDFIKPPIGSVSDQWEQSLSEMYRDGVPDLWGDVGAIGWKQDLATDLPNTLLPGKQDEATWQHLVRFVIAPKAEGFVFAKKKDAAGNVIFDPSSTDYTGALTELKRQYTANKNVWITPSDTDTYGKGTIDDLWHMALNSRGMFYPSESITSSIENLLQAFNDILVRNVSGSALATNTSSLREGGQVYQAAVESDWKGHLRAFNVVQDKNNKSVLNVDIANPVWDLAQSVSTTAWDARVIATYDGASGLPFRWNQLGSVKSVFKQAENTPVGVTDAESYGEKMVEYLRGRGECEEGASTSCKAGGSFVFRRRNLDSSNTKPYSMASNPNGRNVLGDIANSNPWLTPPPPAGFSDVDFPGYNQHRVANKARPRVLYVGANDGMLHAVRAEGNDAGKEIFAYIPSFVQTNLPQLAKIGYSHKYYVDGSPFSSEVDISGNGTGWKTVLAGGANKGGKGYYLLDVTNPVGNTEAAAANWVMWEFTKKDNADLHYTYNLPIDDGNGHASQLARMNNNKWALIVGNGYPEDSGKKACLFILYVNGPGEGGVWDDGAGAGDNHYGSEYIKLCAGNSDYSSDGGLDTNGLSTPRPVDVNGDGRVDYIYAGDLNGNLWRFDVPADENKVGEATVTKWGVANSGSPLFVAKNEAGKRQPFVSPPSVIPHTVKESAEDGSLVVKSGRLVLAGTGKYLENSDRTNTDVQSFYAVWDRDLSGLTRGNLFKQTFNTDTPGLRTQSSGAKPQPRYCTASTLAGCPNASDTGADSKRQLGWYWDMPTSGERLTGKINVINGVVLFNTFFPAPDYIVEGGKTKIREVDGVPQLDPCQYGGDGWLMGMNAVYGYMEDRFSIFDVNQDGLVNSSDTPSAGVKVGAAIGGTTFATGTESTKIGIYSPTNLGTHESEGKDMRAVINVGESSGRVSWYELLN